ncbi:peptide ABC transporter ATP-binding protein [Frondihabitans sp. PAMC 28766]|uniref:ABC transporter ATP-binding protein n=1 Tax=Frondihabitans sp. PAMC 28766 TaxID=1795630 RepID=UPI00078CEF8E|nr:ABC transporter ATP-binding protein [Frondihabitans sp. PAMC 28766]AMM20286.1 peptide ABC transporter ATP-binding protein [Frondihabitans sp. PAMC 28766]
MSTTLPTTEAQTPATSDAFLRVEDLKVHFPTDDGVVKSVDGLSFELRRGEILGIVGESGSGKSVTSQAILGLHKNSNARLSGKIYLDGKELIGATEDEVRELRGSEMAMIFQDPLSALHPFYSVGSQIGEAYLVHNKVSKKEARAETVRMLAKVGIPNPENRYDDYPHQFSGGMRQRAMIAMALICKPKLLIADEPTTALDVTVQAQVLELIKELHDELDSAVIIITHDLGVVAETCDKVLVMYGGQCVEKAPVEELFYNPEMPYTWGLLRSMPRVDRVREGRLTPIPGQPPSLINVPKGCVFNARCPFSDRVGENKCFTEHPNLLESSNQHEVRCHIPHEQRVEIFANEIFPTL